MRRATRGLDCDLGWGTVCYFAQGDGVKLSRHSRHRLRAVQGKAGRKSMLNETATVTTAVLECYVYLRYCDSMINPSCHAGTVASGSCLLPASDSIVPSEDKNRLPFHCVLVHHL